MYKRAYDFKDPFNPANNDANKVIGAVGGGLIAGAGSDILGRLLGFSKKRRWLMNGMAMAGGGFGGYKLGDELTDKMWYPLAPMDDTIGLRMPSRTRRKIEKIPGEVADAFKNNFNIDVEGASDDLKGIVDQFKNGKIRPVIKK